jgi:probable rRNA maturation factor
MEIPTLKEFNLGIVMMSDEELLALNQSALGHDYYTDILTFEIERTKEKSGNPEKLEAELYFSVDRARENAKKARVSLEMELVHLAIHGVLHLAGYDDHEELSKKRMVNRERFFLGQYKEELAKIAAETPTNRSAKRALPRPHRRND